VNIETLLRDTLAEDSWDVPVPQDVVPRVEGAFHRRRRRRIAAGTSIGVVVLVGVLGTSVLRLNTPQPTSIRPAAPPAQAQQEHTVSAAVRAAQQAAAEQYRSAAAHPDDCPKDMQQVTPAMGSDAYQAVVGYNERLEQGFTPSTLRLDRVTLAADDGERGVEVTATCGPATAARTLVVYTTRTDMGASASLAAQVYFVSRGDSGVQVWRQAH
jgi:hypothetical protein